MMTEVVADTNAERNGDTTMNGARETGTGTEGNGLPERDPNLEHGPDRGREGTDTEEMRVAGKAGRGMTGWIF